MRDELSRIESIYGCVAEYNRCMEEREMDFDDYEQPSEVLQQTEITKPLKNKGFMVGENHIKYGFYGGVTNYIVKEIDRKNGRILLAEEWVDVDGNGTRPAEWHKLETTDDGNERALEYTSETFGDVWIYA